MPVRPDEGPMEEGPAADMYIGILPLPGRTAGTRFATTDDDLGITCESSLYSVKPIPGQQ